MDIIVSSIINIIIPTLSRRDIFDYHLKRNYLWHPFNAFHFSFSGKRQPPQSHRVFGVLLCKLKAHRKTVIKNKTRFLFI